MKQVNDDQRAFEILKTRLAKDPSDPVAPQIAQALGLDHEDIRAATIVAKNPADMRNFEINEMITAKVADRKPPIQEQGVTDTERWNVKNMLSNEPEVAAKYLQDKGYQTKFAGSEILVRKPGDVNYKVIEPSNSLVTIEGKDTFPYVKSVKPNLKDLDNFSWKELARDSSDMMTDIVQGGIEAGVEAGSLFFPGSRFVTVPATTGAIEIAKQGAGKAMGIRDSMNPQEAYDQAKLAAVVGGGFHMLGRGAKAVSNTLGAVSEKVPFLRRKGNAQEILEAGKTLGVDVQPSQIMASPAVRNLQEDVTDRTFRPAGMGRRASIAKANDTAKEVAESLVADRSKASAVESGSRAAAQMTEELAEKIKPAEAIYEAYENKMGMVTVPWKGYRDKLAGYKEEYKHDKAVTALIKDVDELLPGMRDLVDLKKIRSAVGNMMQKAPFGSEDRRVLGTIYSDLTGLRTESLLKRAKGNGDGFFAQAQRDIGNADKIYKESIGSVADIMGRGKKVRGSPKAALDQFVDKTREFDLTAKVFDLKDPARLAQIKKAFPKSFEILRRQKLEDIAQRSMEKGAINFKRLANNISDIPDESLVHLFGEEAVKDKALKAKALKVIGDSIPNPSNPSGTAAKVMRGAGDVFTGGALYTAGILKALPLLLVPEIYNMSKDKLLDVISNPVTQKGLLNQLYKQSRNPVIGSALRFGAREGLQPPPEQKNGLTIPGR